MSQSDMLAPDQLNDALLEMQKNEQLHFAQQPMIGYHRHQKIHESSQFRKNHGNNKIDLILQFVYCFSQIKFKLNTNQKHEIGTKIQQNSQH